MELVQVAVVVVPFVAQGHLNQLLHLSRLLSAYHLPIHVVGTTTHNRQAKLRIHGWDPISAPNIHFHEYEIPHFASPPPNPNDALKFPSHLMPSFQASSHLREPFAKLLATLSPTARRIVVIHDHLMATVVQDVASFANAEAYAFHCGSAFITLTYLWEAKGRPCVDDAESQVHLTNIPSAQGCEPPEFIEMLVSNSALCEKFNSGNLYDTSKVFEAKFLDLLMKETFCGNSKQWAMGPFNPVVVSKDLSKRHKSLEWLDKQGQDSVIYVSFGTTTTLADEQVQELAIGLEESGQPFIWVLRDADKGDIFKGESRKVELPEGFEERVEGTGLVLREWAPQLEILGHPATGGFMSHCGWNSSMESITMGVAMITWPMHSDQPRNAMLLTDVIKIGVSMRDWALRDEVIESVRIKGCIQRLMGSSEMRERAVKLGANVRRSVEKDGVTRKEIDSFVSYITR